MGQEAEINTVEDLAGIFASADNEGQADRSTPTESERENESHDSDPHTEAELDDESADNAESEDDDAEEAADEEGQAQAPTDDVVIKWNTPNGDVEASLSELKSGYLRQSDYTQKTQQLAEERRHAEAEIAQKVQLAQQLTHDQATLMQLQSNLEQFQNVDWNTLYQQDPIEAGRLQAQWRQTENTIQQLSSRIVTTQQAFNQERAQKQQQATQVALQVLQRDIPNFSAETINAAREAAKSHGYTDADLNGLTDPRAFKVLYDAAQWQALQAKKPDLKNKVKGVPPKATKQGTSRAPATKKEAAWKNMNAKRDVNSLAALIAVSED